MTTLTLKRLMTLAISAAATLAAATAAHAQSSWTGNAPVFQSDVEAKQRAEEAARATRQKSQAVNGVYPKFMDGGGKPDIQPQKPPVVYLDNNEQPGTIIVATAERKLYYILPGKQAYAYPISVGRVGFTWTGTEKISNIVSWPTWTPPPEMRQRQPGLPITVSGGLINPLGAKALYLGNTIYRIHGTNNERSIGRASSSGCFRMMNEHVTHLASLAHVGTIVRVMPSYQKVSESAPLSSLFSFGASDEPAPAPAPTKKKKKSI